MNKFARPDPPDPINALQTHADALASSDTANTLQETSIIGGAAKPSSEEDNGPAPTAFGRYDVQKVLGSGSFGTVYLGHDKQLERLVAIKVLRSCPTAQSPAAERLLQEARKLARLSHSGIVTVHDVGIQDQQIFVVSNYLEGQSLADWLKQNAPSWQDTALIVAAICDALVHAHSHLTIHRDIKPANIILTSNRSPVLVDFGLALDESSAGGHELGLVSGTPVYMAPEQFAGTAHRIDGRTDIYSVGVVLYEMLCRRLPFRAPELRELMRQVRDDEPQPPRQLSPTIPPDLERICLKALAKKMQDRYSTAADFAEELRIVIQTPSGSSRGQTIGEVAISECDSGHLGSSQLANSSSSSQRRRSGEAERRQVTVLVCGCKMFEGEAYLDLDVEVQSRILQAFGIHCEPAVQRFEGAVIQCDEQGLLCCFGYPIAHEDAARRAARTGLLLLDQMSVFADQIRHEFHLELEPWIGIHTGPAVVEADANQVSLVGEARNVAIRLERVAVPGQVICTEDTQQLFRGRFQCISLGRQKIKGMSQPIELFRVEKIAVAGNLLEAIPTAQLSPLTGRDLEISLLMDRWTKAQEAMGQVVLLVGEPGLGKSRLVHTLKTHVLDQKVEGEVDAPVIEWRCSPHYQNTVLHPAIDFYERALGFCPDDSVSERFDRMLHRVSQYDLARPEVVPLWASLLSLPTPERFPPLSLTPVRQREETFRLMLEWLRVRAARSPVLFVVEDLHWADASTLEFIGQLLGEFSHDRLLALLTFRPEFKPPWGALDHLTSLSLARLNRRQVGELMRKSSPTDLQEALIEQVFDRTGGVPFFVEEFTKMVLAQHANDKASPSGGVKSTQLGHEIPSTLQDLVMARLDRMEGDRQVAQLAAVIGREFSHELLAAVAELDEPTLASELATLAQADILYPKGRPPRCTYIFKHALLVDALYNSLMLTRRQAYHRRVGEALESQFSQIAEAQPELLAHHFTEAGMTDKAICYWLKAGRRSRERSADCEAINQLIRGLGLLNTTSETHERDLQELQFLTTLCPAYIAARGYAAPEVGPILLRAQSLCQRLGEPQQLFGVMLGMWEWHLVRGDLGHCMDLANAGMAFAESHDDPGMRMEALFMSGVTFFYRGQFSEARDCYVRALAEYDDLDRTKAWSAATGHNAGVTHRCYLALSLWHLGYPDHALVVIREALELARAIGHAFSLAHAVDFAAFLSYCCRLGTNLKSTADEEIAIATEQGFPFWHSLGTLHLGASLLLQGKPEEALPNILKGFEAFRSSGAEVRIPAYLGMLAETHIRAARFKDAKGALEEAFAFVQKNDDRCHEAELFRLQGELIMAESPSLTDAAELCFRKAIDTARSQQSRAWELRATISFARLWDQQGRGREAYATLTAICRTYTEGLTTPDLVDASTWLESHPYLAGVENN